MSVRLAFALIVASALFGCGDPAAPPPEKTPEAHKPAPLDRTKPGSVAIAWVWAWTAGGDGHEAFEFLLPPGPLVGHTLDYKGLRRGVPVKVVESGHCTGANYFKDDETIPPFALEDFPLPQHGGGEARVSIPALDLIQAHIRIEIEGQPEENWTILLRPEGSLDKRVVVTPETRWRVIRTRK